MNKKNTTETEEADSLQSVVKLRREYEAVKAALWDYHHALDTRQHGGVAQDKCVKAVETARAYDRGRFQIQRPQPGAFASSLG